MAPRRHGNICCVAAATEDHNRTQETDGTHTRPPEEELWCHKHTHTHFIDLSKKGGLAKDISGTRQWTVQACVTARTNTLDLFWIGPAALDHPFT